MVELHRATPTRSKAPEASIALYPGIVELAEPVIYSVSKNCLKTLEVDRELEVLTLLRALVLKTVESVHEALEL